jgi:hypothetical protein
MNIMHTPDLFNSLLFKRPFPGKIASRPFGRKGLWAKVFTFSNRKSKKEICQFLLFNPGFLRSISLSGERLDKF